MPRTLSLRKMLAAITMAAASLCGGGKAVAEEKGTLSIVELRSSTALRPDQRKSAAGYLRSLLNARGQDAVIVPLKAKTNIAVWTKGDANDVLGKENPKPADFGIHPVERIVYPEDAGSVELGPGQILLPDIDTELSFIVSKLPAIAGEGIESAEVGFGSYNNEPVINFRFTEEATRTFAALTRAAVGEQFAIVVDGVVISAPTVREPILGGSGQISGSFTVESATELAMRMTPPPLDVEFVVQKTCVAGRPRAPPSWAPKWVVPEPACD